MNYKLRNLGTKEDVEIDILDDKQNVFIYGKNGSGKTTFSKLPEFDKKFVFNEDYICKNIYSIQPSGASIEQENQVEFTKLWVGEDEVELKENILKYKQMIKDGEKILKEDIDKILEEKILPIKIPINASYITDVLSKIKDERFNFTLKDVNEEAYKTYNIDFKLPTSITMEVDFDSKVKNFAKIDFSVQLMSILNENISLKSILLNQNEEQKRLKGVVQIYNDNIKNYAKIKDYTISSNKITTKDESLVWEWIKNGLEIYDKDKYDVCIFCGSVNLKDKLEEMKKLSQSEAEKSRKNVLNYLENILRTVNNILERKDDYISFAPKIINACAEISEKYLDFRDKVKKSNEILFDQVDYQMDELILNSDELVNNLLNYILNENINELGKLSIGLLNTKDVVRKMETELSELMVHNSEENCSLINDYLKRLDVNKKVELRLNNRGAEKTYEIYIEGNKIKELSSGEKHKLALAVFLSFVVKQKNLINKKIIFDDPVVSTDTDSYHCFKNIIIDLEKNKFDDTTKLFILTHNIDYLYVQISNIFHDETFRNETVIYKLYRDKLREVNPEILSYDDIILFKRGLDLYSNTNEFLVLGGIIPKIFRYIIDIKLSFQGVPGIMSSKKNIDCVFTEIEMLKIDEINKKELQKCRQRLNSLFENGKFTVKDVIEGISEICLETEILGIEGYIEKEFLKKLKENFSPEELKKEYSNNLEVKNFIFDIVYNASKILDKNCKNFVGKREYFAHPRNQITKNIVAMSMDEKINM